MQVTTNLQANAGAVAPEMRQQRASVTGAAATDAGNQTSGKLSQAQVTPVIVTSLCVHASIATMRIDPLTVMFRDPRNLAV